MTRVLGISAFHSDAAAALVVDGQVIAAAQEERFTGKPRDPGFPKRSIRFCLQQAGIQARDLDLVVFYEKPLRKFERVLATQLGAFPKSARSFARSVFVWLGDRLWIKNHIAKELGVPVDRIGFVETQVAAGTLARSQSGSEEAAVLTVDDAGEWASTTLGRATNSGIEILREVHFPHSLGFVVSAMTQFLGFAPGADEHLLEALSAYGQPKFADTMRAIVPRIEDGFRVDLDCFRYAFDADRLYAETLVERLGLPRFSGDPLCFEGADTRHADLAASLQVVLEERVLELAHDLRALVELPDLCVGGELARNGRLMRRLAADGPFERLHLPLAPGKAGAAVGAALYGWREKTGGLSETASQLDWPRWSQMDWGEGVDDRAEAGATAIPHPIEVLRSRLLAGEKIAWVRGRMEFGDRSLGNRIVLAVPTREGGARELLAAIQHVEPFLPLGLFLPTTAASTYLDMDLSSCAAAGIGAVPARATDALRAAVPEVIAPDGMVQAQLVDPGEDPELFTLLDCVGADVGHPLLVHAAFAPRGVPMVRNEADAVEAFRRSSLDALVVAGRLYEPAAAT